MMIRTFFLSCAWQPGNRNRKVAAGLIKLVGIGWDTAVARLQWECGWECCGRGCLQTCITASEARGRETHLGFWFGLDGLCWGIQEEDMIGRGERVLLRWERAWASHQAARPLSVAALWQWAGDSPNSSFTCKNSGSHFEGLVKIT